MHIITLSEKDHFEYLMYVFHKHVTSGVDPEELAIAGKVWAQLKNTKELSADPEAPEVIQIPGPLSIVHEGDVTVPINPE